MSDALKQAKAALRAETRARVAALSVEQRCTAAADLCSHLRNSDAWRKAKAVLFFAPLPDEPDVWPLLGEALNSNTVAALPRFEPTSSTYVPGRITDVTRDIHVGKFQIREPKASCVELDWDCFDLVLVPGMAFDAGGGRLGRGRGFFDQLLRLVSGKKCGVAFAEQLVAQVPAEAHDWKVDAVVTPAGWRDAQR